MNNLYIAVYSCQLFKNEPSVLFENWTIKPFKQKLNNIYISKKMTYLNLRHKIIKKIDCHTS